MQKINFILFLVILCTGCSAIRKGGSTNYELSNEIVAEKLLENVIKRNITTNSFFIQKAEIEITTPEGRKKLLASLKFESPDKYLISIKSRAGIEAARIFISDDSILINDRINRKQFYGSPQCLKSKYGITTSGLPVMLGDYVDNNLSYNNQAKCSEGKLNIDGIVNGIRIKYVIDCEKEKSILAIHENNMSDGGIEIQYSDFLKNGNILIPGKIEIKDVQRRTKIEIRIQKIESPWNGNIDFIPGYKYEKIQLL